MEFCGEIDGDGSPNPDREDENLIEDYWARIYGLRRFAYLVDMALVQVKP
jgi:hypothetical protein